MTMRIRCLAAAILVASAGCEPSAPSGKSRQVTSNGGGYTVTFEPTPNPIPMNEVFDLRFTVAPKSGSTQGLTVQVDARMPAHGHGMNRVPKLTAQPDGSTKAEGMLFHMPGHWELYFDITQAGKTERAQVDVELK
jgi:hypothetical protein